MLLIAAVLAATLTPAQKREVIVTVWSAFQSRFYDPKMRGVDWAAVRDEFLKKSEAAKNIEPLVFDMLARLRNSHTGLMPADDWKMFSHRLPFVFDHADGRTFVTAADVGVPLKFGDEILTVDGRPARELRPKTMSRLAPARTNPYYGARDSVAEIETLRDGVKSVTKVRRMRGKLRPVTTDLGDGVIHLHLFGIQKGIELPKAAKLVLDLRHCEGGWLEGGLGITSQLLGPGKAYNTIIPRAPRGIHRAASQAEAERIITGGSSALLQTIDLRDRFDGPTALLVNWNTGSECEVVAAALKEHGRVRVFGTRTEGAFNGWSETYDLPYGVGTLQIPVTGSRSSKGIDYEGTGVQPDEQVPFDPKRDAVLERAVRWLKTPNDNW